MCLKTKKAILVVSYGSSYKDEREKSIGGIEQAIQNAFPEHKVYRAFTSEPIIKKIKNKEDIQIDTVGEALERAISEGIKEITLIQTHFVQGLRHEKLLEIVEHYKNVFKKIDVTEPILRNSKNREVFAGVLEMIGHFYDDGETAICCVGHGIDEGSNVVYQKIQEILIQKGFNHYYVGTLSETPTLKDLKVKIEAKKNYRRVVLIPFMLVSGYHVRKDLAGPGEDSWKNTFIRAGFEVKCIKKGLGEDVRIQNIFAEHVKDVIL